MTQSTHRLYPNFSSQEQSWETRPARYFLKEKSVSVGDDWDKTQLLSLTKQGVIDRDIDSGIGKYPASFEGYQVVEPGYLVFCLFDVEETPRTVGLVKNRGMITSAYTAYVVNENVADPRFLEYFFISVDNAKRYRPYYSGLRNTIPKGVLLGTKLSLPPVEEQKAIADFLDRELAKIDLLLGKQEIFLTLLTARRKAKISQILSEVRSSSGVVSGPIKRFFTSLDNRRIPLSAEDRGYRQGEYPYYGASGVIDHVEDFIFSEPLILVAEDGANLISRSTPLAFEATGRYWVNNHAHVLKPIDGLTYFWSHALQDLDFTPWVTGAAQPKLTAEALMNIPLQYPKNISDKQGAEREIKEFCLSIDTVMVTAGELISSLAERRKALISSAVTGKINVRGKN